MGLVFLAAILLYSTVTLLGVISLASTIIRHKLYSRRWGGAALVTAIIWIIMLWVFGLNPTKVSVEYANISIVWNGLVSWASASTGIGMFAFLFARRSPLAVGVSTGFAIAAVWWLFHILSLTQWR